MPPNSPADPAATSHLDPALDGLRGLAILWVFLFHYGGGLRSGNPVIRALGYLTQSGWIGVHLFFALSGFLITGLLWTNLRAPHALRSFFARRALRILPLYLAALLLAAIAALLTSHTAAQLRPILLYAAFLQNIPPLVPLGLHYPPPLALHHLWSLAVEEQFYLLWPFLLLTTRNRAFALRLCLVAFALCCLFRAVLFTLPHISIPNWSPFLLTRAGALTLGSVLALLPRDHPRRKLLALTAIALGAAMFLAVGLHEHTLLLAHPLHFTLGLPAVELASVGLLALTTVPGLLRSALSLHPLRFLGRISYGIYVLHILLEPLFDHLALTMTHSSSGTGYQAIRLLLAFAVTVALASLSFRFLETPFLRLKRLYPHSNPAAL